MRIRRLTIPFAFLILLLMSIGIIALAEPPNITSFSPKEKVINDTVGAERKFEIKINQAVNVSWLINGAEVQKNESVIEASYINKSAVEVNWNITAIAENQNGTAIQTWIWNVAPKPSIVSSIVSTLSRPIPLWFLIVLLILVVISTASFTIILTARPRVKEYGELEKENKTLQKDIKERKGEIKQKENIIKKLEKENKTLQKDIKEREKEIRQRDEKFEEKIRRMKKDYEEYESNKREINGFRENCLDEFKEIKFSGEKIKEKTIESVADVDPFRDEDEEALKMALNEYWKLISLIKKSVKEKEQIYEEEKRQSSELIGKLEKEGIKVGLYKKLLEDSNADGLKVLHSSLNYMNARLGKREFNPETIRKLKETREKINKMMVDWGIKIVPSKLLDFCEKLIKETPLPEGVYQTEKTVEAIINLINEMYIRK